MKNNSRIQVPVRQKNQTDLQRIKILESLDTSKLTPQQKSSVNDELRDIVRKNIIVSNSY